jgi:hypothetical protein
MSRARKENKTRQGDDNARLISKNKPNIRRQKISASQVAMSPYRNTRMHFFVFSKIKENNTSKEKGSDLNNTRSSTVALQSKYKDHGGGRIQRNVKISNRRAGETQIRVSSDETRRHVDF